MGDGAGVNLPCTLEDELRFSCALLLTRSWCENRAADFLWHLLFLSSSLNPGFS